MSKWFTGFLNVHGERLVFMLIASAMGAGFVFIGLKFESLKELIGSGTTILIGVGMLCYNKARSNGKGDKPVK